MKTLIDEIIKELEIEKGERDVGLGPTFSTKSYMDELAPELPNPDPKIKFLA
jgi:hypothetical protein